MSIRSWRQRRCCSLAAAVLTLRVYPLPMRGLARALHARVSLTPFLGAAGDVRDPAGGLVPALVMVLGVSVITFSTVLSSTIVEGAQRAAWNANGAQIRMSGPQVSDELIEIVRAVPGVADVALVAPQTRTVNVIGENTDGGARVFVVSDSLAQVHAAAPLVEAFDESLYNDSADNDSLSQNPSDLTVLTGGSMLQDIGTVTISDFGRARVVGHINDLPGIPAGRSFVVVAQSSWEAAGRSMPTATAAMISVTDDGDREAVASAVQEAVPASLVQTPQQRLDSFTAAPSTSGLTWLFIAAVVLTTAFTALAILMVQALGGPRRIRLLALLRTMGAGRRDARALSAWEVTPLLGASAVVGAVLGAAIPWLLLQAVDLRGVTGSPQQPELVLDPLALSVVGLGVLLVVAMGTSVSAALASRADLAQHLRLGEER